MECGANEMIHAGINSDEHMSRRTLYINDSREKRARFCDDEASRFKLELKLSPIRSAKVGKHPRHLHSEFLDIKRTLFWSIGNAEASAKIDEFEIRERTRRIKDKPHCADERFRLPDVRANMLFKTDDEKAVAFCDSTRLRKIRVIYAELALGAARDDMTMCAGSISAVDAKRHPRVRIRCSPPLELRQGVEMNGNALPHDPEKLLPGDVRARV